MTWWWHFIGGRVHSVSHVTRREWNWVIVVSALVVAASTLPYVAGYLAQTTQARFGGALVDQTDYYSHLAKMWQGYRGQWRYRLLFTPEAHPGVYLQTFYVALGHFARLFGLGLPLTYQIARVVFGFLMLMVVYCFIAYFVAPVRTRRVAFLLATTASGLGWLVELCTPTSLNGISPIDFWLLDGFTYLAVLTFPHFCAATALLLVVFLLLLHRPDGPGLREGMLAGLASLALGLIHPYTLLLADLLPALYWTIGGLRTRWGPRRGLVTVALMGGAQVPLLAYVLWIFRTQPVFVGWSAQNVTLSPPLRVYLWGYGVLLVLGTIGVVVWMRRGRPGLAFPLLWLGLVALLVYLPWNLQRRFLEGVPVPLGLLAGVGLAEGLLPHGEGGRPARNRRLLAVVIALAAMSNLYLTAGLSLMAATRMPAMFWPADLLVAVDWLGEHSDWDETVLAAFETGSLIPARIGHQVVLGHWMETVNFEAKRAAVAQFYVMDTPNAARLALVRTWNVGWVFYGPQEQALDGFNPAAIAWLEPAFQRGDVMIYQVRDWP